MNEKNELCCPECGSKSIDILEDEGVAICTGCYLEWPYSPSNTTTINDEYAEMVDMIRTRHQETIAEADTNPDKWFELFVSQGDAGTHTVESADTFDEIVVYIEKYAEQYGFENINIDIWENREHPNNLFGLFDTQVRPEIQTPTLTDGAAYTIYLKNGRKVFGAIYHHCTLSGKHYFAKGDSVYPIEEVYSHGIKPYITSNESPQIFREMNYGHKMEIVIETIYPHCKLSEVPDSVYEQIFNQLAENSTEGSFELEDAGDIVGKEMRRFSGWWSVAELDYKLLFRIGSWDYNRLHEESLTLELFERNFGKVMGEHYHSKWINHYKHHLINMVGYLSSNPIEAQTFCNMLIQKVQEYEQRTNHRR